MSEALKQAIQTAYGSADEQERKRIADGYAVFRSKYPALSGQYLPEDITQPRAKLGYAYAVPDIILELVQTIAAQDESDVTLRLQSSALDDILFRQGQPSEDTKDLLWLLGLGYPPTGYLLDEVLIPLSNMYSGEVTPELMQEAIKLYNDWRVTTPLIPHGVSRLLQEQVSTLNFPLTETGLIRTVSILLQNGMINPQAVSRRGMQLIQNWLEFASPEELAEFRSSALGGILPPA